MKVFLAFILISLAACSTATKQIEVDNIDKFIQTFRAAHKEMTSNDITFKNANTEFTNDIKVFITDSMGLSNTPFIATSIKKLGDSAYIVHFENQKWFDKKDTEYDFPHTFIDVFAITDSAHAVLIKQSKYQLYNIPVYHKALYLDKNTLSVITQDIVYNWRASITNLNGLEFSLGNYLVVPDSIVEIKKKY